MRHRAVVVAHIALGSSVGMAEVFFFLAGIGAVAGALGVVTLRNPFYAVLALVSHLLCLAALFLLLRAEFVAAAQVIVYAGAVMVLYVFVVAYVGGQGEPMKPAGGPGLRALSALFAGVLFVELTIATLGSGLSAIDGEGAPFRLGFGTPEALGELFLTRFLLAFELASFLLLVAAVGAVVLARRRGGLGEPEELGAAPSIPATRPALTGTMREAVGGQLARPGGFEETDRTGGREPESTDAPVETGSRS
jgi:NADH:ubiquinone oxidoreductase subunit 6 (subunit J)